MKLMIYTDNQPTASGTWVVTATKTTDFQPGKLYNISLGALGQVAVWGNGDYVGELNRARWRPATALDLATRTWG